VTERKGKGHADTFARDALPPRSLWPEMRYDRIPELAYPTRLNCAAELLDRMAEKNSDHVVFHFPGGSWTYGDLLVRANQIAHVLVDDLGLVPGNRVLLRGFNNPMMAACWFAILKAGGIVVCTMPLLRARELTFTADKARITLALTDSRIAPDCRQAMTARADGSPREGGRCVTFGADGEIDRLMSGKPTSFDNCDTAADDVALIAFTSGTTGEGKGTMHFHRDVLAVCDCFPKYVLDASPDDVFCGSPPFAFTYGLGGIVLFPMRIGASALLLEQTTPGHLLDGIEKYRPTVVFTAPTAYRALCGMLAGRDVSSLKKCVSAGETLPLATFEAWEKATGIRIIDGIGATEMLHIFISAAGDEIRPGATGKVVPGYEALVVDEHGIPVPDGTVGKLAVRGPTGCRYLDNIERQRAYVQNGWNLTGDSYVRDRDGYFWYQARTDDMIISSGYNISGPEVENVLLLNPKVKECAVVGLRDEERGQVVSAFVVLSEGVTESPELEKELQDFVKREIAPYKYPRRMEFVTALPRTATGKLQRYRLRELVGENRKGANAGVAITRTLDKMTVNRPVEPSGWKVPSGYAHGMTGSGRVVVTAGQIGWNPTSGEFESDDFAAQTAQALRNVVAVLDAAGAKPEHLVRLTWFVTSRGDYLRARKAIGAAYRDVIGKHYPAMSVVVVSALVEERAKVEIEATAVVPE
jgi:2-aminobenzoate-CoA ligase